MWWFSSKPKKFHGKIGKVSLRSFTQIKLPDTIKWRVHNLFCLCTSPAIQIIWQTYQTLRITSALLDLDFQTDHLLPDSIITLCTPWWFSLGWRTDRDTGNSVPYSFRIVCGFFNVPQSWDSKELWRGTSGLSSLKNHKKRLPISRCDDIASTFFDW